MKRSLTEHRVENCCRRAKTIQVGVLQNSYLLFVQYFSVIMDSICKQGMPMKHLLMALRVTNRELRDAVNDYEQHAKVLSESNRHDLEDDMALTPYSIGPWRGGSCSCMSSLRDDMHKNLDFSWRLHFAARACHWSCFEQYSQHVGWLDANAFPVLGAILGARDPEFISHLLKSGYVDEGMEVYARSGDLSLVRWAHEVRCLPIHHRKIIIMRNALYSGNMDVVLYFQAAGLQFHWDYLYELVRVEKLLPMFHYVLGQLRPIGNEPVPPAYHKLLVDGIAKLHNDSAIRELLSIPGLVPLELVFERTKDCNWVVARQAVELGYTPLVRELISPLWSCNKWDLPFFLNPFMAMMNIALRSLSPDDLMRFAAAVERKQTKRVLLGRKEKPPLSAVLCRHVARLLAKYGITTGLTSIDMEHNLSS